MLDISNSQKVNSFMIGKIFDFGKLLDSYCNALIDESNGEYWFVVNAVNKRTIKDHILFARDYSGRHMFRDFMTQVVNYYITDNYGSFIYEFSIDLGFKDCPVFAYVYIADCNSCDKTTEEQKQVILSRIIIPAIIQMPKDPDDTFPLFDFTDNKYIESFFYLFIQCIRGNQRNTIKMLDILFSRYGHSNGFKSLVDRLIEVSCHEECSEVTAYLLNKMNRLDLINQDSEDMQL